MGYQENLVLLKNKCVSLILTVGVIGTTELRAQIVRVNATSLTQAFQPGGLPVTNSLSVSGGGSGLTVTISPVTDSGGNWLAVTPFSGTVSDGRPIPISIGMDPEGLPDGTYTGTVAIKETSLNNAVQVSVTITVGDPGPQLPSNGLVNAASFQGGAISPGEIVTPFGSEIGPRLPYGLQIQHGVVRSKLAGTRVWFDTTPAPLIYAFPNRLAAIVPYDAVGKGTVKVQVENKVARTLPLSVVVQDQTPAFLTADSSGNGQVAALNEDGSSNSAPNPATKGSIVAFLRPSSPPISLGGIIGHDVTSWRGESS